MKHSTARNLGVAILCIGLVFLAIAFYVAYEMLTNPVPGLAAALKPGSHLPGSAALTGAGLAVTTFLLHLAALFVLTIIGSAITGHGIRMVGNHAHSVDAPTTPMGDDS